MAEQDHLWHGRWAAWVCTGCGNELVASASQFKQMIMIRWSSAGDEPGSHFCLSESLWIWSSGSPDNKALPISNLDVINAWTSFRGEVFPNLWLVPSEVTNVKQFDEYENWFYQNVEICKKYFILTDRYTRRSFFGYFYVFGCVIFIEWIQS